MTGTAAAVEAYRSNPSCEALAEVFRRLTDGWTDEECEDGGQIADHLSDHMTREEIAAIPADWAVAAWSFIERPADPTA